MRLILISGLGADRSGNGLLEIGRRSGLPFDYYEHNAPIKFHEFDCYIGHSLGANRCLELIKLHGLPVKYFAAIDFVHPSTGGFWIPNARKHFIVPSNVVRADCFKRKGAFIPPSSRILNADDGLEDRDILFGYESRYRNYEVGMSHSSAPRNKFVVDTILKSLKEIS